MLMCLLDANVLIGNEVICPEAIVTDITERLAFISRCGALSSTSAIC